MKRINLTPEHEKVLETPVVLSEATMIGSLCDNCGNDGKILLFPVYKIVSMQCGEEIDELNYLEGKNIIELIVDNGAGEETFYIYDFLIVPATNGKSKLFY